MTFGSSRSGRLRGALRDCRRREQGNDKDVRTHESPQKEDECSRRCATSLLAPAAKSAAVGHGECLRRCKTLVPRFRLSVPNLSFFLLLRFANLPANR